MRLVYKIGGMTKTPCEIPEQYSGPFSALDQRSQFFLAFSLDGYEVDSSLDSHSIRWHNGTDWSKLGTVKGGICRWLQKR